MTGLPLLVRGQQLDLCWEPGCAYELENGEVYLIALCSGTDEAVMGIEPARAQAVARVMTLLPPGFSEPRPLGEWQDLLAMGRFGHGRQFIASPTTTAAAGIQEVAP